jgi:hypothetical protein
MKDLLMVFLTVIIMSAMCFAACYLIYSYSISENVKVGTVWVSRYQDPFKPEELFEIIEIKEDWIKYKALNKDGEENTDSIDWFLRFHTKKE